MVVADGQSTGHGRIHCGDTGARHGPGTQQNEDGAEDAPAAHGCVSSTHAWEGNEGPAGGEGPFCT